VVDAHRNSGGWCWGHVHQEYEAIAAGPAVRDPSTAPIPAMSDRYAWTPGLPPTARSSCIRRRIDSEIRWAHRSSAPGGIRRAEPLIVKLKALLCWALLGWSLGASTAVPIRRALPVEIHGKHNTVYLLDPFTRFVRATTRSRPRCWRPTAGAKSLVMEIDPNNSTRRSCSRKCSQARR